MDIDALYARYVKEYEGVRTPGSLHLMDLLGAEIDEIIENEGSLEAWGDPNEEGAVLNLYSINEAKELYEHFNEQ